MKAIFILWSFLCFFKFSFAQNEKKIDSLLKLLSLAKDDTARFWAMHDISYNYLYSKPDSSAWYAQHGLALAKKIKYQRGVIRSMNDIANALNYTGSYSAAIALLLEALENAEKLGDENMKATTLGNISEPYSSQSDYKQAINYTKKSLSIDIVNHDTLYLMLDYLNLGDFYEKAGMSDSALPYANKAFEFANQLKDVDKMGAILYNLGNIQSSMGNDDIALPYFRKAVMANQSIGNYSFLSRSYYSMAILFKKNSNQDSSLFYVKKSYETAAIIPDMKVMLDAATLLAGLYKTTNADSTVKYLTTSIALKDSLFNQEKIKQIQSLTINEQLRQSKLEEEKEIAAEERNKNLQMAGIAAFIPAFLGLILFISKRKTQSKTLQFLGLIGLLLMFEFISMILHPFIGDWTHHTPILMLIIMVLLAALLVPIHHKLEHWLKEKLLQKTIPLSPEPDSENQVNN